MAKRRLNQLDAALLPDLCREASTELFGLIGRTCRVYVEAFRPARGEDDGPNVHSIFLDAGEKELSLSILDSLLSQKNAGSLELEGGLKRQIRIFSEDFDDDLASRAEDLLE